MHQDLFTCQQRPHADSGPEHVTCSGLYNYMSNKDKSSAFVAVSDSGSCFPPFNIGTNATVGRSSVAPPQVRVSFKELELAQQLLDGLFRTRLQSQAGGHVLRLLDPQLVGHAGLCEGLRQAGEGGLVRSLENTNSLQQSRHTPVLERDKNNVLLPAQVPPTEAWGPKDPAQSLFQKLRSSGQRSTRWLCWSH